jgi:hypothetical protein
MTDCFLLIMHLMIMNGFDFAVLCCAAAWEETANRTLWVFCVLRTRESQCSGGKLHLPYSPVSAKVEIVSYRCGYFSCFAFGETARRKRKMCMISVLKKCPIAPSYLHLFFSQNKILISTLAFFFCWWVFFTERIASTAESLRSYCYQFV